MDRGLQIASPSGAADLTPEQKRFNHLIRQIGQVRATLAAWHENIALYAQTHTRLVVPLMQTLAAARRESTFALDRLLDEPGWNREERSTLRELVCESAAELLDAGGEDDPALKALFDKHGDVDFDTEQQRSRMALKDSLEAMTGLNLGDPTDIDSDEDLFIRMQEKLAAHSASAAAAAAQAPERARRPRRKTPAQQRREAEAQLATQSVREIFRKLASALHPDRETDPARRDAKTVLMQKVNQAYAANDLLTLLELQLQIEQIDAGHIANITVQRLKHYNKVLAEQLVELKTEVERVEAGFRIDFGLQPGWGMNPTKLIAFIKQAVNQLRAALATHQHDMRMLADKAATRRWLKRERQRLRYEAVDDGFF